MNLKELKYVLYGDDRLSSKLERVNRASSKTDRSLNSASNKAKLFKNNIRGAADEIPFLNSGLRLMTNPLVVAGGLITGIATGFNQATNEAIQFKKTFRELTNLNLDKSRSDIAVLKRDVLSTAADMKFDPLATSVGYYDIQSVTGEYGYEVKKIVGKQGEFAKVMQANFNKWIEGTGKAMANYGFGSDQLDAFNRSGYATVNVGSITFDQLANIQSQYAGSAAAAKQSFNSANKLLTLFTVKTKSAEEAATLTKSAFTDLFKASTVKAFKKAGIDMFDSVTGKARQVDQIMIDLNKRFMMTGSDQKINDLRNQFKGSEGLNALIQTASDKSGNFLGTLETFNKVDFNFGKALKDARQDIDYINTEIQSLYRTTQIQLGEQALPWKLKWSQLKLTFLSKANAFIKGRDAVQNEISSELIAEARSKYQLKLSKAHLLNKSEFESIQDDLIDKYHEAIRIRRSYATNKTNIDRITSYASDNNLSIRQTDRLFKREARHWDKMADMYRELSANFVEYRSDQKLNPYKKPKGSEGEKLDTSIQNGLSSISGGGTQVRNVNVTIQKLVELLKIETTNINESAEEIEQKIEQILVRAIGGAEQVLSN